jgi:hypothetical protein
MPTGRDVVNNTDTDLTDSVSILNRINSTINVQDPVVRRLGAIRDALQPEGPPQDPQIIGALNTALQRAQMQVLIINKIFNPATPGDVIIP